MIVLSVQKCHHSILKKAGRCTFEIKLLNQKENAFSPVDLHTFGVLVSLYCMAASRVCGMIKNNNRDHI